MTDIDITEILFSGSETISMDELFRRYHDIMDAGSDLATYKPPTTDDETEPSQ